MPPAGGQLPLWPLPLERDNGSPHLLNTSRRRCGGTHRQTMHGLGSNPNDGSL
jgi:hypothetical protein